MHRTIAGEDEHAVTFLTLVPNQHGETVGVEHRVSVFGDGALARTPGAASLPPGQDVEHFGKIIEGDELHACVDCHTTTGHVERGEVHNLRPHVQCERCHGPGSEHVDAKLSGSSQSKLQFVPGTKTALEEITMCGRCHRLPEMLSDTRLERSDPKLARYQSVGLLQSPCYVESHGKLRCTTCHDPHERAAARSRA
ncbi:MAG: multiheme c-type cytochrome, partial [Planctomycetaceae bacterium]